MAGVSVILLLLLFRQIICYDGSYEEETQEIQFPKETMNLNTAKADYDRLVSYSQMPSYGSCWSDALENLHHSCKNLNDRVQKQFAFEFANCFLEKTGVEKAKCLSDQEISACAQNQSQNFFTSYVHFFTHTQSVCFYISSELWQKRAEKQVLRLMDASHIVTGRLEEAHAVQALLLEQQKSALGNAEEIRLWIGNVADRIAHLQNVFIDEFTGFYSLIFYFVSTAGCFVLTATRRTAGARFWIFLLLIATFALERFYTKSKLASMEGLASTDRINRELSADAWLIRRTFWLMASAVLLYCAYSYVDINQINTDMIREIRSMLERSAGVPLPLGEPEAKEGLRSWKQMGMDALDGVRGRLGRRPLGEYEERERTPVRERSVANAPRMNDLGNPLPPVAEPDDGHRPVREASVESRGSRAVTPLRSPHPYNLRSSSVPRSPANFSVPRNQRSASREPTPEMNLRELRSLQAHVMNGGSARKGLAPLLEENGDLSD